MYELHTYRTHTLTLYNNSIHYIMSVIKSSNTIMRCPKCNSDRINLVSNVTTKGYSDKKAATGCVFCGLPGLLFGLCGSGKQQTSEFWICNNCGTKFQKVDADEKERKIQIAQSIVAAATKEELQNMPNLISQARTNVTNSEQDFSKELEKEKTENIEIVKALKNRKYLFIAGIVGIIISFGLIGYELVELGSILFILSLLDMIMYKKDRKKTIEKYGSAKLKELEIKKGEDEAKLKRLEDINNAQTDLQGMLGDGGS